MVTKMAVDKVALDTAVTRGEQDSLDRINSQPNETERLARQKYENRSTTKKYRALQHLEDLRFGRNGTEKEIGPEDYKDTQEYIRQMYKLDKNKSLRKIKMAVDPTAYNNALNEAQIFRSEHPVGMGVEQVVDNGINFANSEDEEEYEISDDDFYDTRYAVYDQLNKDHEGEE
jgi:hypothetical protein